MRYGAMNFPINPIVEEIRTVAALGMDFVELALDPPQAHYSQAREHRQAILDTLKSHGLGLVCHMPTFVHTADLTEGIRRASLEEVLRSMETAVDLGAEKAVLHPGYYEGLSGYVPQQAVEIAMLSLDTVHRRALELGLVVCVENLFARSSPFVEPEHFEAIFSAFPAFRLVLDIAHAFIGEKTSRRAVEFISRFPRHLAHLHVSDNKGSRDDHLPVGAGAIPFKTIARALRKSGYDGTITLEVFVEKRELLIESRDRLSKMLV